jgi:predicted Zn-dependent protease
MPAHFDADTARRLMERALALSRADETEIVFSGGAAALTRFSNNAIHQHVAESDATLEIRAVLGTCFGSAATNDLSEAGIERAVTTACHLAEVAPRNPEWPGLPGPQTYPELPVAFDEEVAALCDDAAARAHTVAHICAASEAVNALAAGSFSVARSEYAILNSKGLFAHAPSTQVEVTYVFERDGASSYAHATGWRLAQIDGEALKVQALRRLKDNRPPRAVPAGEYPVVLEPYAVLTLLEAMIEDGMGALAVQEERSWMNPHLGQRCMSPAISITDDALAVAGFPRAFDCEGMPKHRVAIVRDGVPLSPVYDRVTAAREPGRSSTGHAQPHDDEDWDGPAPENLVLSAGAQSVEELIRATGRGLFVSRFWYVRQTSSQRAAATGTTRDGVWWIEGGELAYPVRNLRFDQELVTALGGVRGVGRDLHTLSGFYGVHRVPALALDSFRFIGEAEA